MRRLIWAFAVFALAITGAPRAQGRPSADDRAAIAACIGKPGAVIEVCRDVLASPCFDRPGGETTAGSIACYSRARAVWETQLAETLAALDAKQIGDAQRRALAEAQARWSDWRTAECAYAALQFEGGTLAGVARAGCLHDETAERTLTLMRALMTDGD